MLNDNRLCKLLNIDFPLIMAPMFLVTNEDMVVEAANCGIAACIPALNYRTTELFKKGIREIRDRTDGSVGVNLIVNKSNIYYKEQLNVILESNVNFVITSLGNPKDVITKCHARGIKVLCDVEDLEYAKKVELLGADGVIAVNSRAGGHAGHFRADQLISLIRDNCSLPLISAGGIGQGGHITEMLKLGADGVSVGTLFIATKECLVSKEYKQAIIDYGEYDIVFTERLSGTPCTVINTPFVKKIGIKLTFFEKIFFKNRFLKKFVKMLLFYKGTKLLRDAAYKVTYKTFWCAGPALQYVKKELAIKEIIEKLKSEFSVKT